MAFGLGWSWRLVALVLVGGVGMTAYGQATGPATRSGGVETAPAVTKAGAGPTTAPAGEAISVKTAPGKFIDYPDDLQKIRAYWVTPDPKDCPGPWPGVIVVHDIFGLTAWTQKQADALAAQGYAVIVPDLYTRQDLKDGCPDAQSAWIAYEKLADQQAMGDIRAAVAYLATADSVGEGKPIGVVGHDMGGIYAMILASSDLRVKVAINYYGRIIYPENSKRRPISPVEYVFNLRAPLLSFYGKLDPAIPAEHLARLEARLGNNPNNTYYEVVKYPNVGHGFLVETRQGYNPDAAKDAQGRSREFLAKILRAAPARATEE